MILKILLTSFIVGALTFGLVFSYIKLSNNNSKEDDK